MLTKHDEQQLAAKGISIPTFEGQLNNFKTGFPYLKVDGAATIGSGIVKLTDDQTKEFIEIWDKYKAENYDILKFVPASGAASRMFKNLFAFLDSDYNNPTTDFEKYFFANIKQFAFYDELNKTCLTLHNKGVEELVETEKYKTVVAALLKEDGMNYGQLPKGLLLFHKYDEGIRTAMEEHLVEAAQYASTNGKAQVHFTVSEEHIELFKQKVEEKKSYYEQMFNVSYDISFSTQKASTDTVAANPDNTPFRNDDSSLLFRPGGHGALIQNLNELNADIVFIKNIDNVVPDHLKDETTKWKKVIAGVLVELQQKCFDYLKLLKSSQYDKQDILTVKDFLEHELCCKLDHAKAMSDIELVDFLIEKLNRPIRVCGMVKNSGEPGGGPFFVYNADNTISLQILESSQLDVNNPETMNMFTKGTHFNPVDLVCATKDYKGNKFNLPDFVDPLTGFISKKSKNGKELKALELPGLWNGAMSNWNTIFVEVPAITFNPVKTVNDLLREQHQ
ncbi:DUF4301 family protein [Prevotella disiens]|uniref:DUF4301 family protein n=1 Tax=Prevotella disiens TaxID=28130 RepID=UPI002431397B|nr:DUF4301 family protein [Prevotella disiens]